MKSYQPTKKSSHCITCVNCVSFVVLVFGVVITLIAYTDVMNYDERMCLVTNASYPTHFPTSDTDELWHTCRCGKTCISRYPCVKLFVNHSSEYTRNSINDIWDECTFTKDSCPDGEEPINKQKYIDSSIKLAKTYLNKTIACYVYNSDIDSIVFMNIDKTYRYINLLVFGSLFVLWFICNCVYCISLFFNNDYKLLNKKPSVPAYKVYYTCMNAE